MLHDIIMYEVHPALSVGNCPLLGLVWLKSHVQSVVCGTRSRKRDHAQKTNVRKTTEQHNLNNNTQMVKPKLINKHKQEEAPRPVIQT